MDLSEFRLDHEFLSPFINTKRTIEEMIKNNSKILSDIEYCRVESEKRKDLNVIIKCLFEKLKEENVKLSLRDIFNLSDEVIDDIHYLSDLRISDNRGKKPAVATFLIDHIKKSDYKYLTSPCFIVNMSCFDDFDTALSIFNFGRISINEELMNLSGRNSSNVFIPAIGVTNEKFKTDNIDVCLYLTKKILNMCFIFMNMNLSFNETKSLYEDLDGMKINSLRTIINSLDRINNRLPERKIKQSIQDLISSLIITQPKITSNSYRRILDICQLDFKISRRFMDEFDSLIFVTPYFLIVKYTCLLCNITFINEEFIETIISITNKKNEFLLGEFAKVLGIFIELSKKRSSYRMEQYLTRSRLNDIYEFGKYIYVDKDFLMFYLSFPYEDDLFELIYIIYLIKGSKITGSIAVDHLNFILSIKTDMITLERKNDKLYYNGSHIGRYYIGKKDNNLFCRVARLILFRGMFDKIREFELLSENCDTSILCNIPYSKIKLSKIREFYNQTIDVHNGQRDEDTRRIYERFLGLNSFGEFINIDPDSMGEIPDSAITADEEIIEIKGIQSTNDPWGELDKLRSIGEKNQRKMSKEYQGNLSDSQIEFLFNEFWNECRKTIIDNGDKLKFFRVMGVNFEMEPIEKNNKDFEGFMVGGTYIRSTRISQKLILAHLWNFCKKNQKEGLCDVMINCYKKMIQAKKYIVSGKDAIDDYSVCNDGKLQYFACSILQGRIKDDSGDFIIIDRQKTTKNEEKSINTEMTSAQMYDLLKPFYDGISEEGNIPNNCDEMFRRFFCYIKDNELEGYIKLAIETLCLYSEGTSGFIVNTGLALPSLFSGYFDIDDYDLIKNYIDGRINEPRIDLHHFVEDDYYDSEDDEIDVDDGIF